MKKIFLGISIIFILVFMCCNEIYAANLKATIDIEASATELKAGETVVFTMKIVNIENAEGGVVGAVAGKITYDKNFFEEISSTGITLNSDTGDFTKMDSFTNNSSIGTISLKVKSDATGKGNVQFTNLAANDGRDDYEAGEAKTADKSFEISIKTENTDSQDNNENDGSQDTDKENENKDPENKEPENKDENKDESKEPSEDKDKQNEKEAQNDENNKQTAGDNTKQTKEDETQKDKEKAPTALPDTGIRFIIIPSIIVLATIAVITFAKYKKYRMIK